MSSVDSPSANQALTPRSMIARQKAFHAEQVGKTAEYWLRELEKQTADDEMVGQICDLNFPLTACERDAIDQFRQNDWTVLVKLYLGPMFPWLYTRIIFKSRSFFDVDMPMPPGGIGPDMEA